jgi:hypothetical protein
VNPSPFTVLPDGRKEWEHKAGDSYVVTGRYPDGRRFRAIIANWCHVAGINLWRGHKWLVRDGKRYLIQSVVN